MIRNVADLNFRLSGPTRPGRAKSLSDSSCERNCPRVKLNTTGTSRPL